MRLILIALILCSCVTRTVRVVEAPKPPPPAAKPPAPPPVNRVCEAFAAVNKAATCSPIYTDLGPSHVHTATITLDQQQIHCRYDIGSTGILCASPISIRLDAPPPTEDKPAKKKIK